MLETAATCEYQYLRYGFPYRQGGALHPTLQGRTWERKTGLHYWPQVNRSLKAHSQFAFKVAHLAAGGVFLCTLTMDGLFFYGNGELNSYHFFYNFPIGTMVFCITWEVLYTASSHLFSPSPGRFV